MKAQTVFCCAPPQLNSILNRNDCSNCVTMVQLTLLLLSTTLLFLTEAHDAIGSRPVNIDIEWVLQGQDMSFSGFFIEFLGISSAMVTKFPQIRFTKSLFLPNESSYDPTYSYDATLLKQLFPRERKNLQTLLSTTATAATSHNADSLVFDDRFIEIPDEICKQENIEEVIASEETRVSGGGVAYTYSDLSKSLVSGVSSNEECCLQCLKSPLCLAWTYLQSNLSGHDTVLPGDANECRLKGRKVKVTAAAKKAEADEATGSSRHHTRLGLSEDRSSFASIIKKRVAIPPPRVLIFHGSVL
jgi:hypothetical protein